MTSEGTFDYVSFLPELDDFLSDDFEVCMLASTSALPEEPTPASVLPHEPTPANSLTKTISVRRQQRVVKRSTSASRGKRLEVLPLVTEEDEIDGPTSSSWSSDEERSPSSSAAVGLFKRMRKQKPRPLGFIGGRASIAAEFIISPAAFHDESTDEEVVFSFPTPPPSSKPEEQPSLSSAPALPALIVPDSVEEQRGAQSPTPSVASSSSASSAPRTPASSDDESDASPSAAFVAARNKPLPPCPKVRHSDGYVENDDQENLWERRINEIFELLASGENPLADSDEEAEIQLFPSGPAVRVPLTPESATTTRRRSYSQLIPKRPPPPVPEPVSPTSPMLMTPPDSAPLMGLGIPSPRIMPPRSPVPVDIPVDVRASMSTVSGTSYSNSSFIDAYFALESADLRSRFSVSTRSSVRFASDGISDSGHSRKSKSSTASGSSSSSRTMKEGLRRKGIPVELFMRSPPTSP